MKISMLKKTLTFKLLQALTQMSIHKQESLPSEQASEFLRSLLKKSLININIECVLTVINQNTLLSTADQPMCLLIQRMNQRLLASIQIHKQKLEEIKQQQFEDKMTMNVILVFTVINNMYNMKTMIDSGLCYYAMIKSSVIRCYNLQHIPLLKPQLLTEFDDSKDICTHYMMKLIIDVEEHQCEDVYIYKVDNLDYNLIVYEDDIYKIMDLTQISANAYEIL
ncbi:uncharacterized protein BDCG_16953 [Blastomyces dermatitidis ER-3]|uniref:Uncharacterized protein n=1 Tax=Ajellomyces dermatitidis (strain ER-3 / ATCC MYA-2586) TaxID=559297 RepID=A0ABX2VVL3_AJEDR|nr:uncharacterized protein BDCG_16953 [Blastomyces dermatitidis ER-3]OAT01187.1 hypothetical protein BDCG_16953 [Blastomyces dermatitidis ER-3]